MAEETTDTTPTLTLEADEEQRESQTSKFIRFQDENGDGLPDACDVEIEPAPAVCKGCIPNPQAINPDWKKLNQNTPRLNEKICKYQITYITPQSTTGHAPGMSEEESEEALEGLFDKYAQEAAVGLLIAFQKDTSQGTILKLVDVLEHTSSYLRERTKTKLKLLYSVDAQQFDSLPAEDLSEEDKEEENKDKIKVTYSGAEIVTNNIRTRKGLKLHGRFYKVARAVENKLLRFKESNKIFDFDDYGDSALFTSSSPVGEILRELDTWLNTRGYNISNVGSVFGGIGDDKVKELKFVFDYKYNLIKLKVFTEGCGSARPAAVYGRTKLRNLTSTSSWKDKTAVAYFAKMKEIEKDLSSRVPMPFEEFVVKHTYPKVFIDTPSIPSGNETQTVDSCIRGALEDDFKQLGQDIFDEVFSLADAIAYKFHKSICQTDLTKINEDAILKGINFGAGPGSPTNIFGMAKMQAFEQLDEKDQVFSQMCFRMLSFGASGQTCGLSSLQAMDQLYAQGLGRIKICGLMDLMLEAMECLFKGLSLEDALASIVRAALSAMGVTEIGELFVGLPPEKQLELERAVKQKLESGDIFAPGSAGQSASDAMAQKKSTGDAPFLPFKKPWEDEKFVKQQESNKRADNYGNMKPSKAPQHDSDSAVERRTIGQKLQKPLGDDYKTNNIIVNAYVEALLEVYQDNFLELIDHLNKFPGAQLISSIIAMMDCPTPPLFNPGFDDFFKSLELPFCRNGGDIIFPRWENPFLYIPKLSDILAAIFKALKELVKCIVMKVIVLILSKICEIIGDAICKALEVAGTLVASLPALATGRASARDLIREAICGPSVPDKAVDDTILELISQFGVGGAAFADTEKTLSFFADIVNASTREESLTMFIDGPNEQVLDVVEGFLDTEYLDFREALPTKASVKKMFINVGNVIPAATMNDFRQALTSASEAGELQQPANPSLCATPEALDAYNEQRCALLEGRMSTAQCKAQNEAAREQIIEDLDDLGKVLNQGVGAVMQNAMPPVFSDPDCDNGLLPSEPEESKKIATGALKGDMQSLQIAFTDDMLGNGGLFAGKKGWGFINMVLSDTLGNPFTAHQRKVFMNKEFVDYNQPRTREITIPMPNITLFGDPDDAEDEDKTIGIPDIEFDIPADAEDIRGAYPYYVAEWLKYQFSNTNGVKDLAGSLSSGFKGTNDVQKPSTITKTFDELGFKGLFDTNVELTELPEYGYNTTIKVNYDKDTVKITREARKETPDIKLKFKDNAKGYRQHGKSSWAYGFTLQGFYSDIIEDPGAGYINRPGDSTRIKINELINQQAKTSDDLERADPTYTDESDSAEDASEDSVIRYTRYEFFAVDNSLDNIEMDESNYPLTLKSFLNKQRFSPQVYALSDISGLTPGNAKTFYDNFNDTLFQQISSDIGSNEKGWIFGAQFDDLTKEDLEYGVNDAGIWKPYEDYRVPEYNDDGIKIGTRPVTNDDGVLGISRYQHDVEQGKEGPNRVFYLNPAQFGNNYMSPSIYIEPLKSAGWLGMVDVMFPDYSPCRPRNSNLIAFDDIQEKIDEVYPRIPEDKRLKSDPDCIMEVPFNRILGRPARAGLEGLVTGAIRIFVSTHFIKALPVFSKFAPKFPTNYSNVYSAYIVERIEESFKANDALFEGPFKDSEFWYAFLEQAVQSYSRRLDDDQDESVRPETVPLIVQEAIERINTLQERYDYPYKEDFKDAPSEDTGLFETLKSFRESKNLEAVQFVEEDAKLILQEMVNEQLIIIGSLFTDNLKKSGFAPDVVDNDYYFMQTFAAGASSLSLQDAIKFVEQTDSTEIDAAKESGAGYTTGDLFALPDGTPYIGDYHVNVDDNGDEMFMVGAEHSSAAHDFLVPFANNVIVGSKNSAGTFEPIGDVAETIDTSGDKKFYIRKYVEVDGTEYNVKEAESLIRRQGKGLISDYYPGSLKLINGPGGVRPVGLRGNLGVRHGLEFGIISGGKIPITNIKIDALDLPVAKFIGPRENSKLLLCLINNLKDDPKFRITVDYIFSMKKTLSMYAIYNDMGFLPSIGEWVVPKGDMKSADLAKKPGVRGTVVGTTVETDYTPGWAYESDRNFFGSSPFFLQYDEWDQQLLRKSVRRIKKIFKPYYRKRKFEIEDDDDLSPAAQLQSQMVERFKSNPAGGLLPWHKSNKVRSNPFNSKGSLCKKND